MWACANGKGIDHLFLSISEAKRKNSISAAVGFAVKSNGHGLVEEGYLVFGPAGFVLVHQCVDVF